MCKKIWAITKINFKTINAAYWVAGITFFALFVQEIVFFAIWRGQGNNGSDISLFNTAWLLVPVSAIIIPTSNFRRIINLGGRRNDFLWGSVWTYAVLAGLVSLVVALTQFTIEPIMERHLSGGPEFFGGIVNLTEVFGWVERGFAMAFLQQFAFLFFGAAFVHTLTALHHKWYGLAADVLIVAVISVFTPITPLRAALAWFFNLVLFHQYAFVQIGACLVLAMGLFMINKMILARQAV